MAFTDPTPSDVTQRFPVFAGVETDIIDTALIEAASHADDSWVSEADFRLGRMLYAAHVLTCDGHGATAEAELAQAGYFTHLKSGSLSLTAPDSGDRGWLQKTSYGRRYVALRRRSVPAVAVLC